MKIKMSNQYIAGFMDGEGSVYLRKNYEAKKSPGKQFGVINIWNSNKTVLETMQNFLNLGRVVEKRLYDKRAKLPCYSLRILKQNEIIKFLDKVIPYLIVKKQKAMEVLEYLKAHPITKGTKDSKSPEYKRKQKRKYYQAHRK